MFGVLDGFRRERKGMRATRLLGASISIWGDKAPKREKIAENCSFFYR